MCVDQIQINYKAMLSYEKLTAQCLHLYPVAVAADCVVVSGPLSPVLQEWAHHHRHDV